MEKKKSLIVVGASGKMGVPIIKRATAEGYKIDMAVVGPDDNTTHVYGSINEPIKCQRINEIDWFYPKSQYLLDSERPIIIDVTHKSAIGDNYMNVYKKLQLPLIIGTIGISKEDIATVDFPIIIGSPNFSTEIVKILKTFRSGLEPGFLNGLFYGWTESHQGPDPEKGSWGKRESSGTADFMGDSFKMLGAKMVYQTSIRDEQIQRKMGVEEQYLSGHGWHTYHFMSFKKYGLEKVQKVCEQLVLEAKLSMPRRTSNSIERWNKDRTLQLKVSYDNYNVRLSHNVNGRNPYIDRLFDFVLPEMATTVDQGIITLRDMFDFV
jgi:hypothetical protein